MYSLLGKVAHKIWTEVNATPFAKSWVYRELQQIYKIWKNGLKKESEELETSKNIFVTSSTTQFQGTFSPIMYVICAITVYGMNQGLIMAATVILFLGGAIAGMVELIATKTDWYIVAKSAAISFARFSLSRLYT
jgi:hypothetical protein